MLMEVAGPAVAGNAGAAGNAVASFLSVTEFSRAVKRTTGAVAYWLKTKQVRAVEVETGGKTRKRIAAAEVKRVQKNLRQGLPVGFGLPESKTESKTELKTESKEPTSNREQSSVDSVPAMDGKTVAAY